MRRRIRRLGLTLLVGFASIQGGCKPNVQEATQVKTLDNFAIGEKVRTNVCSVNPAVRSGKEFVNPLADTEGRIRFGDDVAESLRTTLRKDISETLTAVPAETQQMFIKLGGYINVTSKTGELCSKRFKQAGKNKTASGLEGITACFTYDTQGTKSRFRINITPNDGDIKHSLVRVFGYMYAQFYSRIGEAEGAAKAAGDKLELKESESFRFANIKIRLAQNFLADMVESKTFDLATMEKIIGSGSEKIIRQNYAALNKVSTSKKVNLSDEINQNFDTKTDAVVAATKDFDLLNGVSFVYPGEKIELTAEQKDTRRRRFEDYVFAEAYDSFYCHPYGVFPDQAKVDLVIAGNLTDVQRNDFFANTEDTRKVMQKFFQRSYDMFQLIDKDLTAIATAMVGKPKEEAPNQDGFALAGASPIPSMAAGGGFWQQFAGMGYDPNGMNMLSQLFQQRAAQPLPVNGIGVDQGSMGGNRIANAQSAANSQGPNSGDQFQSDSGYQLGSGSGFSGG